MHTLRLSLVGAVILMLLAGPGAGVVAGDEEAAASDRPHQVSGTTDTIGPLVACGRASAAITTTPAR